MREKKQKLDLFGNTSACRCSYAQDIKPEVVEQINQTDYSSVFLLFLTCQVLSHLIKIIVASYTYKYTFHHIHCSYIKNHNLVARFDNSYASSTRKSQLQCFAVRHITRKLLLLSHVHNVEVVASCF